MTTPVRPAIDLTDGGVEGWLERPSSPVGTAPTVTKAYPKRSELRRAEARAAGRRGADRRPTGARPPGGAAGRHGPPAPSSGHEPARLPVPHPAGHAGARLPIAIVPRAAVLPIRQTSTATRPAGIALPIAPQPAFDAFHRPLAPVAALVPIVVPAYYEPVQPLEGPAVPVPPPGLAAPAEFGLDLAEWGLDLDDVPGALESGALEINPAEINPAETAPAALTTRRALRGRAPKPASGRAARKGRARAARLLVLALVVGAEGISVTALGGNATPLDAGASGLHGAVRLSSALPASALPDAAVLGEVASRPRLAAGAQVAQALAAAQEQSSAAKATAALEQARAAAARVKAAAQRRERAMRNAQRDPQTVAKLMMADHGWSSSQFTCLVSLWNRESRWNYRAYNPSSGAYGIPQALPGSKMASAGTDWKTNPVTQIRWGLNYIADRYGSPCGAWGHSEATGWY